LSPFTPTMKSAVRLDGFFHFKATDEKMLPLENEKISIDHRRFWLW